MDSRYRYDIVGGPLLVIHGVIYNPYNLAENQWVIFESFGWRENMWQDLKRQLLFLEDDKVRAEGGGGLLALFLEKTVVYPIIYDGF